MSAYEDAVYAMRLPRVTVRMSGQLSEESAREIAGVFLTALPPSIVVDGKVAEVWPVLARLMERDHNLDVSLTNFMDAAREVAGREGR